MTKRDMVTTLAVVAVGLFFIATSIWVKPDDAAGQGTEVQSLGLNFNGAGAIVPADTPQSLAPEPATLPGD